MSGEAEKPVVPMRPLSWPPETAHWLALLGLAAAYFALAKLGLALASVHPSASPVWPPSGLALAALLLWGTRVWPAVFVGALLANLTTFGSLFTSLAIAAGNTCEAVVTAWLVTRWCGGAASFDTPGRVVRFAAATLAPGTMIGATVGVGSLTLAGFAEAGSFAGIWTTWWLGDAGGQLLFAPVILLWARSAWPDRAQQRDLAALLGGTAVVGLLAFSPLLPQTGMRAPLAFLAIAPMLWAALRHQQRDTATAALLLSCFAIWGTFANGGPLARESLNESFLLTLTFVISTALPSLALSADVAVRRRSEEHLSQAHAVIDQRVRARTAELAAANESLLAQIAQRRRAEAERESQRLQLVSAQRLASLGSWAWDVRSGKVTWSPELFNIYGVKPEDFKGTFEEFLSRLHEGDRGRVETSIRQAMQAGKAFSLDERIVRPGGEIRYLRSVGEVVKDERGQIVQMIGVCQDVTEEKKAERALTESEQRNRLLIDGVRDYAIYMLDPAGRVASWNPGAERIKRYRTDEIVGRHFETFYTEEDRVAGLPAAALATAGREGQHAAEGWRVRKDGTRFWSSTVISAIYDDGRLVGFAKITRDDTERRDTQVALEGARDQLAQSQKMEALGQLTGSIAHDFNNLLMIVSGHAQLLKRRLADPKQVAAAAAIVTAAQRGENLTRQLLTFARRQRLSPQVIDTRERIEAASGMLQSSLRGDIQFIRELGEDVWPVEVDVAEFELALVNLAVNARDAMPDGGALTLSVRNATLPAGAVGALPAGDYVAFALADTGVGIAPEIRARIFDPFFTTKPLGKGTGLGLSQVHGFAHQAGGSVEVSSVVGQGTVITLYLPRSRAAVSTPDRERVAEVHKHDMRGPVLVVEDNEDVAEVTGALVAQLGYQVVHAPDAASAVEKLRAGDDIAFVLSDIVMPGDMNGIDLARLIRQQYPHLPVLLTSGYSQAAHAAETTFPILRKPFELSELDRAVRAAIDQVAGTVDRRAATSGPR